jgi:hypothetical protein
MKDINAVFGKDMSGYVLAIYDTLEEIEVILKTMHMTPIVAGRYSTSGCLLWHEKAHKYIYYVRS